MKKVLIVVLALALVISFSITAFADETVEPKPEKRQLAAQEREDRLNRVTHLFEEYYPEGLETFLELHENHKEFHEQAATDREMHIAAVRADFDEIRAAVESGELTRREGQVQIIELRIKIRTMRNELAVVRLEKIAVQGPLFDGMLEIREEIRTLLVTDPIDGEAIAVLLAESLENLAAHVENDIHYHSIFLDIAEGYGY